MKTEIVQKVYAKGAVAKMTLFFVTAYSLPRPVVKPLLGNTNSLQKLMLQYKAMFAGRPVTYGIHLASFQQPGTSVLLSPAGLEPGTLQGWHQSLPSPTTGEYTTVGAQTPLNANATTDHKPT